ncbi:MAG: hypothetical protein GF329_07410, partial [Candidatus Lokiarchaeota archaeon]|nr:hypothetical protein [Candidatus Lokiarchaeota archaeon]
MSNDLNSKDIEKLNCIDYFFNPKTLAIVGGGKKNPLTVSNIILSNALAEGFTGSIYLVDIKPEADIIKGLKVYRSIFDVPEDIDIAMIIVPASVVPMVIEQCIEANVKGAIIITAGFGETLVYNEKNKELEDKILRYIRKSKMRVVGPNCNGVFSQSCNLNATLGPRAILPKSDFSLVTRGGTAGTVMNIEAARRNIGLNKYIGIGDEIDLNLQDFIQYFDRDNNTKVIGAYSEGIKSADSFRGILRNVKKPVVFYKAAESVAGSRAALSHVGALAGQNTSKIFEGVLKQLKIIKADNIDELMDFSIAASIAPKPKGPRIGIWTPGGSMGVIMTDKLEKEGLKVPKLSSEQIEKLNNIIKVEYWSHNNPVDVTDSYNPQSIDKAIQILFESFDGIVVLMGLLLEVDANYSEFSFIDSNLDIFKIFLKQQAKKFKKLIKKYEKPIFIVGDDTSEIAKSYKKNGVIILPTFKRVAKTYNMLY